MKYRILVTLPEIGGEIITIDAPNQRDAHRLAACVAAALHRGEGGEAASLKGIQTEITEPLALAGGRDEF